MVSANESIDCFAKRSKVAGAVKPCKMCPAALRLHEFCDHASTVSSRYLETDRVSQDELDDACLNSLAISCLNIAGSSVITEAAEIRLALCMSELTP